MFYLNCMTDKIQNIVLFKLYISQSSPYIREIITVRYSHTLKLTSPCGRPGWQRPHWLNVLTCYAQKREDLCTRTGDFSSFISCARNSISCARNKKDLVISCARISISCARISISCARNKKKVSCPLRIQIIYFTLSVSVANRDVPVSSRDV